MTIQSKDDLKSYFETGDRPTQQEFADLIDSMVSIDPGTGNVGVGLTAPDVPEVALDINGAIQLRNGNYRNRIATGVNGDLLFYMEDTTTVGMRFITRFDDETPAYTTGRLRIYDAIHNLGIASPQGSGGADYAEYFESKTGKAIALGIAVAVGDQGKIHPAKAGETPVGIISTTPLIAGNNPMEWPGKYLRDELGQIIMETYEEDEPGSEKAKKQRPKLNPDYDDTREYIMRQDREEWCCIGLLGQLPLRKGQPVAPTWIKLYEISDKADMWLVK